MVMVVNTADVSEIVGAYLARQITFQAAIGALVLAGRSGRQARDIMRACCYCQPPMTEPCGICRELAPKEPVRSPAEAR